MIRTAPRLPTDLTTAIYAKRAATRTRINMRRSAAKKCTHPFVTGCGGSGTHFVASFLAAPRKLGHCHEDPSPTESWPEAGRRATADARIGPPKRYGKFTSPSKTETADGRGRGIKEGRPHTHRVKTHQ